MTGAPASTRRSGWGRYRTSITFRDSGAFPLAASQPHMRLPETISSGCPVKTAATERSTRPDAIDSAANGYRAHRYRWAQHRQGGEASANVGVDPVRRSDDDRVSVRQHAFAPVNSRSRLRSAQAMDALVSDGSVIVTGARVATAPPPDRFRPAARQSAGDEPLAPRDARWGLARVRRDPGHRRNPSAENPMFQVTRTAVGPAGAASGRHPVAVSTGVAVIASASATACRRISGTAVVSQRHPRRSAPRTHRCRFTRPCASTT